MPQALDPRPSVLAERLLGAIIRDAGWRDAVLGDLREEYETFARVAGAAAARRWHWRETLRLGGRFLRNRVSGPTAMDKKRPAFAPEPEEPRAPLAGLGRDFRYAIRALAGRPAMSAVIVLALALGLAANATIFATADALVLRPFRFAGVERLVSIASVAEHVFFDNQSTTPADFLDWQRQAKTLDRLVAMEWWEPNLVGDHEPEQLPGFRVSPEYFEAVGAFPVQGRAFTADEGVEGRDRVAVVSHRLWTRLFGADPGVVGRTVRLDGLTYEIVGVAPPGFNIPLGADIWSPLTFSEAARANRKGGDLSVIGRLAPGATLEEARAEIQTIVAQQRADYPETNANRQVTVKSFMAGMSDPGAPPFIAVWQVAAVLLLLVACANVMNLLLARGVERRQEFALRLALGAGRGRIVRQLLIEGLVLAAGAVALAAPLAWLGVTLSRMAVPVSVIRFIPGWEHFGVEPRTFLVTAALAAVATVVFSLAPALQAIRQSVGDTLRQGGRTMTAGPSRAWGRAILASAQIGLTLALLTASALAIGAAHRLTRGDLGFQSEGVLLARFLLPDNPYDDPEERRQIITRLLDRLEGIPAIQSAAVASTVPYTGNSTRPFYPEGEQLQPAEVQRADYRRVTPELFDVLRIPLVSGRGLSEADTADQPRVAVVSRALVDRYWPGSDPMGKRFRLTPDGEWITVVGVAGDVLNDWFMAGIRPTFYVPAAQDPPYHLNVVVRTAGDPITLAGELRRAIAAADPNQPVSDLMTMQQAVDDKASGLAYGAKTLSVIGGIALILALVGIYSLMSYLTSRRTQEIGVRVAFGATRADVIRLTVGQAFRITVGGLIVGAALGMAIGQAMQSVLFGAVSNDVLWSVGLAVLLGAAALGASYVPARRAAALDPSEALRAE